MDLNGSQLVRHVLNWVDGCDVHEDRSHAAPVARALSALTSLFDHVS